MPQDWKYGRRPRLRKTGVCKADAGRGFERYRLITPTIMEFSRDWAQTSGQPTMSKEANSLTLVGLVDRWPHPCLGAHENLVREKTVTDRWRIGRIRTNYSPWCDLVREQDSKVSFPNPSR